MLLKLSYSSTSSTPPSPSQPCQRNWPHMARIFEAYIFACIYIRALELLTQVLWLSNT